MLKTTIGRIHSRARRIVLGLLIQLFPSAADDGECIQCRDYEISCWIDGISISNVETFCKLIGDACSLSLNSKVTVGIAWEKAGLPRPFPKIAISPMLVTALTTLTGYPNDFVLLTIHVAACCILFHKNPIPLAAMLNSCDTNLDSFVEISSVKFLVRYAKALIANDASKMTTLYEMVTSNFSQRSPLFHFAQYVNDEVPASMGNDNSLRYQSLSTEQAGVASRFLLHIVKIARGSSKVITRCLHLLRRAIPLMFSVS